MWAIQLEQELLISMENKLFASIETSATAALTSLREYCIPNQKLTCFMLYLKMINIFLKNDICILQ